MGPINMLNIDGSYPKLVPLMYRVCPPANEPIGLIY